VLILLNELVETRGKELTVVGASELIYVTIAEQVQAISGLKTDLVAAEFALITMVISAYRLSIAIDNGQLPLLHPIQWSVRPRKYHFVITRIN